MASTFQTLTAFWLFLVTLDLSQRSPNEAGSCNHTLTLRARQLLQPFDLPATATIPSSTWDEKVKGPAHRVGSLPAAS